jgi:putative membrane protein insertion efficiency factor
LNVGRYKAVIEDGQNKRVYTEAQNNKSEVEAAFSGLFLLYKNFVSSQDQAVCTFTPSCSEYGILSIKQFGVVKGGFMTMDRLTRCNGLSPTNYEYDPKAKLLKDDPISDKTYEAVTIQ